MAIHSLDSLTAIRDFSDRSIRSFLVVISLFLHCIPMLPDVHPEKKIEEVQIISIVSHSP